MRRHLRCLENAPAARPLRTMTAFDLSMSLLVYPTSVGLPLAGPRVLGTFRGLRQRCEDMSASLRNQRLGEFRRSPPGQYLLDCCEECKSKSFVSTLAFRT